MSLRLSHRKQVSDVMSSLAMDFKDAQLTVGCGGRGCRARTFRVGDLLIATPRITMSELLRRMKCHRCRGPAMNVVIEQGRQRLVLSGTP